MLIVGCSAVVTGAASGLGAATAQRLASRGMHVLGLDLTTSIEHEHEHEHEHEQCTGRTANSELITKATLSNETGGVRGAHAPGSITLVSADVTAEAEVAAALAHLREGAPLRVVVNCAGIAPASRILTREGPHSLELFRRVIDVNLTGTFNVLRLAAEVMAGQAPDNSFGEQRGVIINTASIAAYEGQVGQAAYSASKGAIVALTLSAARDLARHGIRVNSIAPGVVETPLLAGLGPDVGEALAAAVPFPPRLATPAEFAQLVEMIAEHDYLNGETIRMDGALRLGPR